MYMTKLIPVNLFVFITGIYQLSVKRHYSGTKTLLYVFIYQFYISHIWSIIQLQYDCLICAM